LDLSANGLVASPTTIGGLSSNTLYYFRATPYSLGGGGGQFGERRQPAIVSVSSEVIDNSGVAVYWEDGRNGGYTVEHDGVFDVSDSSLNG
jgi:hypothetical protein